jgi:hypothetical protein
MQRVAVCEVFWDIPVIGKGYVRTFLRQTHAISIIFELMWKQSNSSFFAAPDNGEEHLIPPRSGRATMD